MQDSTHEDSSSLGRHFSFKRSVFDDAGQSNYLEGSQFDDPAPPPLSLLPSLTHKDVKWLVDACYMI